MGKWAGTETTEVCVVRVVAEQAQGCGGAGAGLWQGGYRVRLVYIAGATNIVVGSQGLLGRSILPETRKMSRIFTQVHGLLG